MEPPAEKMYQTESESSESSDSDAEEKANFFELWKFFENDCRKILRSLLENYFSSYAVLVKKFHERHIHRRILTVLYQKKTKD